MPDPAPEWTTHSATIALTNNVTLGWNHRPTTLTNVTFGHRFILPFGIHGSGEGITVAEWAPGVQAILPISFKTGFLAPDDGWELEFTDETGANWTTGGWQVANCDASDDGQTIALSVTSWYASGNDNQPGEYQAGFTLNGSTVAASLQIGTSPAV
jgi:hypothetical protein